MEIRNSLRFMAFYTINSGSQNMGFALWIDGELAWAAGTHEYRPMGAAVISAEGVFHPRDFHRYRRPPSAADPSFDGFYASVGHLNQRLEELRRAGKRKARNQVRRRKRFLLPGL